MMAILRPGFGFYLSALLLIAGCEWQPGVKVIDSADMTGAKVITVSDDDARTVKMSEVFSEIRYLPLETPRQHVIPDIIKLLFQDGKVFIFSGVSIFIFEEEGGRFVNEVSLPYGIHGGRYSNTSDVVVHPGRGEISILGGQRIVRYTFEGEFVDELTLNVPVSSISVAKNGDYILHTLNESVGEGSRGNPGYNLLYMNGEGKNYKKIFRLDKEGTGTHYRVPDSFSYYGDTLLYYGRTDYHIYELGEDDVRARYRLDFERNGISDETDNVLPPYEADSTFNEATSGAGYTMFISMLQETDDLVTFSFLNSDNIPPPLRAFYSKDSGRTIVANQMVNDMDHGVVPYFMANRENELVAILDPTIVLHLAEYLQESLGREELEHYMQSDQNLIDLAEALDSYGNPVLMFAKTKAF